MSNNSVLSDYKGQVKITGKIYIKNQETYNGSGVKDADTIHINVYPDSISFRPSINEDWKTNLKVLDDCYYKSDFTGITKIIKKGEGYSSLAIRLQGLDAPELHYRAIQNDVSSMNNNKTYSIKRVRLIIGRNGVVFQRTNYLQCSSLIFM